jgi:predicted enzyme related to lactoylglutathione lyase
VAEFTAYAHGTPCWVDVTSTDMGGTNAFYAGLFGWSAEDLGEQAGGYTMYTLRGKAVAAGSPPPPGAEGVPPHWTTYLASDDVDETARRIRDAGGTVLLDPFDVFDSGRMTIAQDPTGAAFGVWQAGTHIGAQLANEPGTLNWNECQTPDADTAGVFYSAVFDLGYEERPMTEDGPTYGVLSVDGRGVAGVLALEGQMAGIPPNWSPVFGVAHTDETVAKAQELGGMALMPGMDLPEIGRLAVLQDRAGAVFQVLQPPPGQ